MVPASAKCISGPWLQFKTVSNGYPLRRVKSHFMGTFSTLLHLFIFISITLRALSRPDLNSTTRIAWIFVLFTLPVFGVILYFLFGDIRFRGPLGDGHRAAVKATAGLIAASGEKPDLEKHGPASAFATSINGFGMTSGNHGELLDSPHAQRERMIADFGAARDSINVLYYIWLDDATGRNVAAALIRAAGRGVKVRAIVDEIGSRAFLKSQTWKDLIAAGVETSVALPLHNPLATMFTRRFDLRNHRKITVIDGRILHCGSQNCADPEFSPKPKYAPWVDIMLRIEGPVARQMNLLFAQNWFEDKPLELEPWNYEVKPLDGGFQAQAVGTGPTMNKGMTAQLLSRILGEARREIVISTPYFTPGDVVADAIMGAAFAGADVTLIVPARNDSGFVGPASRAYYPQLIAAGVKIAEYNGGLLHAKTLTVDGELTFIGSTNLDFRSFDLNFENDVLLRDRDLTQKIRDRQMEYLAASTLVDPAEVRAWSVWKRIRLNAFTTIGPVI